MPVIYGRATYGTIELIGQGIVEVGNFCSIASGVTAIMFGHNVRWVTTFPFSSKKFRKIYREAYEIQGHPVVYKTTIGNDVWIGQNVAFVGDCEVGDGAIIGAGSVVRGKLEPYSLNFGNPCKLLRFRFGPDQIKQLLKIKWWEWDDRKIRKYMETLLSDNVERFILMHS